MNRNQQTCGVAWFSPVEWQKLKAVADDRGKLHDSYDDWVQDAKKVLKELESKGIVVKKVETTVEELQRWCTQNNRKFDGAARSEFAAEKLRKQASSFEKNT